LLRPEGGEDGNGLDCRLASAKRIEWLPSSRQPATVRRTVALDGFESVLLLSTKKKNLILSDEVGSGGCPAPRAGRTVTDSIAAWRQPSV